jgi:hypothetical protein
MEPIYRRDLIAFKGKSLANYRSRKWFARFGWTFILPAILLFPFRQKNKKTISVLAILSLASITLQAHFV